MGIWGTGPVDNDDAADWLAELVEEPRIKKLAAALKPRKAAYMEVDQAAEAFAAAAVLAQLRGYGGKNPVLDTEDVALLSSAFARLKPAEVKALTKDALAAIERLPGSELGESLSERKPWHKVWTASLVDLRKRLARPAKKAVLAATAPKRKRINAPLGSIVAIPLGKKRFAFAKLHRNYSYGVYDLVRDRIVDVDDVLGHDITFFASGTDEAVKAGAWPIIGGEPFADEEAEWGPPMAAGQDVATRSVFDENLGRRPAVAILEKGQFRHCTVEEVIGLDIGGFNHSRELIVRCLIDRLIDGKHDEYRVLPPQPGAKTKPKKAKAKAKPEAKAKRSRP